jgi:hypothetical protein
MFNVHIMAAAGFFSVLTNLLTPRGSSLLFRFHTVSKAAVSYSITVTVVYFSIICFIMCILHLYYNVQSLFSNLQAIDARV